VRAERPKDENELRQVVRSVIENRISTGQLDQTSLTLKELDQIGDSFTTTLRGMYHPRIEYPKFEKSAAAQVDTVPIPRPVERLSSDLATSPAGPIADHDKPAD